MLHDIEGTYDNHYTERRPKPDDKLLSFRGDALLMSRAGDDVIVPTVQQANMPDAALTFLFDISGTGYYLAHTEPRLDMPERHTGIDAGQVDASCGDATSFRYEPLGIYRWIRPRDTRFAIEVGAQLAAWYRDNRFCGRCASALQADRVERMLRCPNCGNTVYPRINPGVIVGVQDGDRLLLTKYAGRGFTNWALVAGFTEIGETLEQTVAREVLEETGVHVKNIRYFGNQPWPRSSSLLVGYFCELDGSDSVKLDDQELACAEWVHWSEVPHDPDEYSLTRTMMCAFRDRFAASANQVGER
ncbi:MAG: NAD(+) diphosphatase [Coriobacteriaceae bacterium]|nr:NAD(+) diphosphatase [Coriobacteriaceae bacterium]